MRVVEIELNSEDVEEYNFLGSVLMEMKTEPFFLRHEYVSNEKKIKQSLYLFGKQVDERGTQVFTYKYFDYRTNELFKKDLILYRVQASNFRLPGKEKLSRTYLLNEIIGEKECSQFMAKDGAYRKRIVYEVKGDKNALIIVFSLDTKLFGENKLFQFVKENFKLVIE